MAALPLPFPDDDHVAGHEGAGSLVDRLLAVCAEVRSLASLEWNGITPEEPKVALKALEALTSATTAIRASVLAAVESSGAWQGEGQRKFDTWVAAQTRTTRSTAGKEANLSKSLKDDLPGTREALANGDISTDHARIISRRCANTPKRRERLADAAKGEGYLLELAKKHDAQTFSKLAHGWAIETDPQRADREWQKDKAKQEFTFAPADDGFIAKGWFSHVDGALIKEALSAHMGRNAKNDTRSFMERQASGLVSLAAQSLDAGVQLPNARVRPHLIVTMEYDTIERLVEASGPIVPAAFAGQQCTQTDEAAWAGEWQPGEDHVIATELDYTLLEGVAPAKLSDGNPIPPKVLARLACNSLLSRVIFGPESTILNSGREERIFTAGQTRAIIARDETCQYPGCDEGPRFGEIHHSISWAKHNGNTDAELGILLCFHHHDFVHERDISIVRRRGTWEFYERSGQRIRPPGSSNSEPPPF